MMTDTDDDDEREERMTVPCCLCGKPTTIEPGTPYGDLCYRCIRADNE
jgi:endogenous inhibitor of DNA gyrase (YacG/DUF329 family)